MSAEKVSGGSARVAQVVVLMFFVPLVSFLSYIILTKNFTYEGITFLLIFTTLAIVVIWNMFSYSDVYISEDHITIKSLFGSKSRKKNEITGVEKALRPFTYHIRFATGGKVNFIASASDLFKQLISLDPGKSLKEIKSKISNDKPG